MADCKNTELEKFKGQSRLPRFAVPKRYDLNLKPDLSTCKFSGSVEIVIDVTADSRFIVLNAADLSVEDGSVSFQCLHSGKEVYRPSEVVLVEEDEILVLGFGGSLPLGEGVLLIRFTGTLNDQMKGFYRSVYEHNGEKKNMAVTQFEPADARRCFPCWDEPAFKATFKITLEIPSDVMALSNMPLIDEKVSGQLKILSFQESPIMSTYLVAIVVGLFDYVEDFTSDGIKVRVYSQIGKTNQGKFALEVAVKTLDFYKKYFSMPYALPKLDMIAIPDFAAGAMENYGLVTYRETALLYDDRHSAAANKQRVANVVAHELAHQWFGNLVTMEWWTHLWLNEGFATWVSYLANDYLFPEWKVWTQFLDETTGGLKLDGLAESHPIEVEINHAREIDEIFDAVSYEKGASLIRMLQSYLGADCFQKALASYIKKYACTNAKTEDLWKVIEEESHQPVTMLMNSWTKQKGYPVVNVKLQENYLEFDQTQFLSSGLLGDGQWIIPITLCGSSYDSRKNFLLQSKSDRLEISEFIGSSNLCFTNKSAEGDGKNPEHTWVKINVDQTGFYRVKYDDQLAARLIYAIEASCLTATDKFGVLDDSYALCVACKQTLSSLLLLMNAYRMELDYTVLSHLINICCKVAKIVADATPDLLADVKEFFISLLQFSAVKLGWEPISGESHLDAMLRGELFTALALLGHDTTINEAIRRFNIFLNDRDTPLLPADMRKAAYIAVMQKVCKSDRSGYESLLQIYRGTDLSQEKVRILSCLTSCPDPDIVLETLNFVLTSEVRNQDSVYALGGISWQGREIAWKWLTENWNHISKTWGSGHLITYFVRAIVSPFTSDEKAKEVEEYFATRSKPSIARTLKQSMEQVQINANWVSSVKGDSNLADAVKELAHRRY